MEAEASAAAVALKFGLVGLLPKRPKEVVLLIEEDIAGMPSCVEAV